MWGATIGLLIAVAGVLYLDGLFAGLTLAAIGSAALLAVLQYSYHQAARATVPKVLEVVEGGANRQTVFSPLHQQAS